MLGEDAKRILRHSSLWNLDVYKPKKEEVSQLARARDYFLERGDAGEPETKSDHLASKRLLAKYYASELRQTVEVYWAGAKTQRKSYSLNF